MKGGLIMSFATEDDFRKESFIDDTNAVPSEQIVDSIDRAHAEILLNTSLTDEMDVADEIVRAEAILAISHWFRARVISNTISVQVWKSHGMQIDERAQLQDWMKLSQLMWREAWTMLHPYCKQASIKSLVVTRGETL
jgi:hypothetical protein